MKGKKQLEIYLQGLFQKERAINYLEQYPTDASNAAYVLSLAYGDGNILGKSVVDLGTGNGVFACGAGVLGASRVLGIDVDDEQISVARKNCASEVVDFVAGSVESVTGSFDTALMNSPFGSVNVHADLPFLEKASQIASFVYSIHNRKSTDFVREYYSRKGEVFREEDLDLKVGRIFKHHTKDHAIIPAVLFCVRIV